MSSSKTTSKEKDSITNELTHVSGEQLKQVYLKYYGTLFQFRAIYYQTDPHVRAFKASLENKNKADIPSSSSTTLPKPRKPLPYTPTHKTPSPNTPSLHTNDQEISPAVPSTKKRRSEEQRKLQTSNVKKFKVDSVNNDDDNNNNNNNNNNHKSQPKNKNGTKLGHMRWESEDEKLDEKIIEEDDDEKIYARKKVNFSEEEAKFLFQGVRKYGNQWAMILHDSRFSFNECRRPVDLKDKWRNMTRRDPSLKQQALFGRDPETDSEEEEGGEDDK